MCVYITWAFVNVSPAMAENVRFGLAIHSKNLCFIASLFLVSTVPRGFVTRNADTYLR